MIEVDVNKLEKVINSFNEYKKELSNFNSEIIYEFQEITKYWHDQRCINFQNSFQLEKNRIMKNEDNINDQIKIYNYIKNKYSSLGNKIKCDLESKETIIQEVSNIISKLSTIIERYNNLGNITFYPNYYSIINQKNSIKNIKDSFENLIENIKENYEYIKEVENKVEEMNLELKIENFSINSYESEE